MNLSPKTFFDGFRVQFGPLNQGQVDGAQAILAAAVTRATPNQLAYLLATAWHETAETLQPVREALAGSDEEAIRRLDRAWARGQLPQVKRPYWRRDRDGKAWFGRGYVQLTHRQNYAKAGELIGVDLIAAPERALEPALAAAILVRGALEGIFTGRPLGQYVDVGASDYRTARRVINGLDRADLIAGYARRFERIVTAARA